MDMLHTLNHRARLAAIAKVARLIEDPSSAESSEILEKYADTALEGVCQHLKIHELSDCLQSYVSYNILKDLYKTFQFAPDFNDFVARQLVEKLRVMLSDPSSAESDELLETALKAICDSIMYD